MILTFLLTACLPLLTTQARPAEDAPVELHATVATDTILETRMSCAWRMASGELRVELAGQPVPAAYLPPLEVSHTESIELVVRDRCIESADGRATRFVRSYETWSAAGEFELSMGQGPGESDEWTGEAEVEGREVEFSWDPEGERYERELVDSEKRPDELAKLDARLDLADFLPPGAVEAGDRWEVEPAALERLLQPGGPLALERSPDEARNPYEVTSSSAQLSARLREVRRVDGRRRALIVLEGRHVLERERPTTLEHVPVADGSALESGRRVLTLEGELVWDLKAGRALELELLAELEYESTTLKDEGQEGPSYRSVLYFSGELRLTVEVEDVR